MSITYADTKYDYERAERTTDRPGCAPWCVQHVTEEGMSICNGPDEAYPGSRFTGSDPGQIYLSHSADDGTLIAFAGLDLPVPEAIGFAVALMRQIDRARGVAARTGGAL